MLQRNECVRWPGAVAVAEVRREEVARTLRVPRVNPDARSLRVVLWIAV